MAKATHSGTCQACGSMQKLPGGRLAKHGYTTRWGFFSGTCLGSGWRPFETHTDLIADSIARAEANAQDRRDDAFILNVPTTEAAGWYYQLVPAAGQRASFRRWVRATIARDAQGRLTVSFPAPGAANGETITKVASHLGLGYFETPEALATSMNRSKATALEMEAAKLDEYIAWQRERLASWQERPLTPVAPEQTKTADDRRVEVYEGGRWIAGEKLSTSNALGMRFIYCRLEDGRTVNVRSNRVRKVTAAAEAASFPSGAAR